jgi:hypothetical protein
MYGTIFSMKPKPGKEGDVIESFHAWDRERRPKVKGALGGFLLKPDDKPGELIGVAIFADKVSYMANGGHPEQDKWYRGVRELLQEDPAWEDGEYVAGGFN